MKKSFLIDINGVLYVGKEPVDGAIETIDFLRENKYRFRFISNATRACRETLCEKLRNFGFDISEDEIFNAPVAAAKYIKKSEKDRCFLLTTGDVHKDFENEGVVLTEENPDFVVVGDAGHEFNFENMNKVFNLLLEGEGAELIAMEKDKYWRTSKGLELSAGPFVTALEYATGKNAVVVGKPSESFFRLVLEDMNSKPENTIVIGDDIITDIEGAKRVGMDGILVKTGKYRKDVVENSKIKPDKILDSLDGLRKYIEGHRRSAY